MNLPTSIDIHHIFLPQKKKVNIQNSRIFCLQETCNYFHNNSRINVQHHFQFHFAITIFVSKFQFTIYVDFYSLSCKHFLQIVNWESCMTQMKVLEMKKVSKELGTL